MNLLKSVVIAACTSLLVGTVHAKSNGNPADQSCSRSILNLVGKHTGAPALWINSPGSDPRNTPGPGMTPVTASACKAWPYDRSLTIVSFAYDEGANDEKRWIVSLVDTSKNAVVASYKGAIQEDAVVTVGSGSLSIDTARYDLAPGVRAFGVDLSSSFSQGCVEGGLGPTRTVFVRDGKALRPILDGFYLSTWTFLKGGPSCASGDSEVVIETTSYSIAIDRAVTNGFADLRVTATATQDNHQKSPRKPLAYVLKYDGTTYPLGTFNGASDKIDKWHE